MWCRTGKFSVFSHMSHLRWAPSDPVNWSSEVLASRLKDATPKHSCQRRTVKHSHHRNFRIPDILPLTLKPTYFFHNDKLGRTLSVDEFGSHRDFLAPRGRSAPVGARLYLNLALYRRTNVFLRKNCAKLSPWFKRMMSCCFNYSSYLVFHLTHRSFVKMAHSCQTTI